MNTSFDTRSQQDTLWRDRTAVETYQPVTTQDDGYDRPRLGVRVDAQRLWAGGAASALVASLVAMVGVLVGRWLFHLSVLAPAQNGTYGGAHTTALIVVAFVAALAATGLVHLLMVSTARPQLFFGWIVGLVTVIAAIFPFSTTAALDAKIATGLVNLAIGAVIGILVSGVAARSSR